MALFHYKAYLILHSSGRIDCQLRLPAAMSSSQVGQTLMVWGFSSCSQLNLAVDSLFVRIHQAVSQSCLAPDLLTQLPLGALGPPCPGSPVT